MERGKNFNSQIQNTASILSLINPNRFKLRFILKKKRFGWIPWI